MFSAIHFLNLQRVEPFCSPYMLGHVAMPRTSDRHECTATVQELVCLLSRLEANINE